MLMEPIRAVEADGAWLPQWTFGDRLRKIRRELGLSQAEFADALGRSQKALSAWEAGYNRPSDVVAMAKRIEIAYRVPASWTLGVAGSSPAAPGDEPVLNFPVDEGADEYVRRVDLGKIPEAVTLVLGPGYCDDFIAMVQLGARAKAETVKPEEVVAAWAVLTAAGFDASKAGLSLPAFYDAEALKQALRSLMEDLCAIRDSNPEPADMESLQVRALLEAPKSTKRPQFTLITSK